MFYCFTASGILKVITLVVGGTAFALGISSYDETIVQEEFFVRTVQAALIVSLIYFGAYLIAQEKMESSNTNKAIDIGFHITAAAALLVAGSLVIYSAVDNERTYCDLIFAVYPHLFCQFYTIKLAGGIVTLLNGVIYSVTAATVFLMPVSNRRKIPLHRISMASASNIGNVSKNQTASGVPRMFYYGKK